MVATSWVAAIVACLGYGLGSVLQSVGAQRTAPAPGVTGVARILLQGPYLLGLGADALAFVANAVALQRLPLFLVQAVLTGSVGVTAVVVALRGIRLSRRDWAFLAMLVVGLVLLSVSASSDSALRVSAGSRWFILLSAAVPAAVWLLGSRLPRRASAPALALAAGLAFSGVAVASRAVSGGHVGWFLLASPLLWAIVVHGVLGTACYALAMQRGAVTVVTAVTFLTELVVPSAVGLLVFGDTVHPGFVPYAALGFVLSVGGAVGLVRYAE